MLNFKGLASVLTDIFNFVTERSTDSVRDSVTHSRCKAVHLARGQARVTAKKLEKVKKSFKKSSVH